MRRAGLDGSRWPGTDTEDLLHAALDAPGSAREAWARAGPSIEVRDDPLDDVMRLLPLVLATVGPDVLGADAAAVKRLHRTTWRDNQLHLRDAPRWLDPVAGEVPVLVMKGMALVRGAYPDLGCRPMSDVDVLVPAEAIDHALALLGAAGWARPGGRPLPRSWRSVHAVALVHPDGGHIDLHHVPGVPFMRPPWDRDPAAPFWAAAVEGELAGRPVAYMAPEDLLLTVVVHGLTGVTRPMPRWVADAVLLLRDRSLDWARLGDRAEHHRVLPPVRSGLRYLVDTFDADVPPSTMWELWARPVHRGDHRRFDRQSVIVDEVHLALVPSNLRSRWYRMRTAKGQIGSVLALPSMAREVLSVRSPADVWARLAVPTMRRFRRAWRAGGAA